MGTVTGTARVLTRIRPRTALVLLVFLGALLRLWACFVDGPLHPDEFMQYIEPAYRHLYGVGVEAWEWRDGVRSWVLPFYNGAWLASLTLLGVPRGPVQIMLLKAHWALINVALVPVAYRGGAFVARRLRGVGHAEPLAGAGAEGGLLAAFLVATFPMLVWYAGHTLSELPSMLCLVAGLVLTAELTESAQSAWTPALRDKAILAGVLLSLGACLRIANAPLVLLPPLWLLGLRRLRALSFLVGGALGPALLFALVDLFTWGSLASSFVEYLRFNLIEGRAAKFGTQPATFYLEELWRRLPYALPLLVLLALWGLRASWPFLLSAFLTVGYLSTQPHKEERFILVVWPFLLIAAAGVGGALLSRARALRQEGRAVRLGWWRAALGTLTAGVLVSALCSDDDRTWLNPDRLIAEAWVADQPDVVAVLMDNAVFGGGAAFLGGDAPELSFRAYLAPNPLMTYVVASKRSKRVREAEREGFERVHTAGSYLVVRRAPK